MNLLRPLLLWGSTNEWLCRTVPKMHFVRRASKRFIPGETLESALTAAFSLSGNNILTIFTHLSENIKSLHEADIVTEHYITSLERIGELHLHAHLSLKLTQLGLDLSVEKTFSNFIRIAQRAKQLNKIVWIDMEGSTYTQITIEIFRRVCEIADNVGICLQAYLYRTAKDLKILSPLSPHVRLVKGAYRESSTVAYSKKEDVDRNYTTLMEIMLDAALKDNLKPVFATHDTRIINGLRQLAASRALDINKFEIHMLYGIRSSDQKKLSEEGFRVGVLISYGEAWFPWYMRRLAERPANIGFVVKNLFK